MKTRKLTAILLALCMLLSLSISAFAADDAVVSGTIPDLSLIHIFRGAVVRLKQDGYALAADRLFSASSMLLQKMAELSPEYPIELLHDDLSRVLSTLFLIGRKLSTFLEPATKRALEQITDKVVLFLRPKTDAIRYTCLLYTSSMVSTESWLPLQRETRSVV